MVTIACAERQRIRRKRGVCAEPEANMTYPEGEEEPLKRLIARDV